MDKASVDVPHLHKYEVDSQQLERKSQSVLNMKQSPPFSWTYDLRTLEI